MALIGLLHVNIMRSTTETQIYFAANDTEDLGDLQIFHSHHYFYREAKRVLVPDCQFSEDGKSLMKGSEVLYSGKDPFVVASVSDEELRYVFDPERCQNPQFLELLANDAVRERLISEVYNDENLSDDEKKALQPAIEKIVAYGGSLVDCYAKSDEIQERVRASAKSLEQDLRSRLRSNGVSEDDLDDRYEFFKNCGFETMKEIRIIDLLLRVHGVDGSMRLNDYNYPGILLDLVGLHS